MSEETATIEVSDEIKSLGDQIAELTLKKAKELSDYLENEYDIKPAAGGGAVMVAGPAGDDAGGAEKSKGVRDVRLWGAGSSREVADAEFASF